MYNTHCAIVGSILLLLFSLLMALITYDHVRQPFNSQTHILYTHCPHAAYTHCTHSQVDAEYRNPHSQERVPGWKTQTMWGVCVQYVSLRVERLTNMIVCYQSH